MRVDASSRTAWVVKHAHSPRFAATHLDAASPPDRSVGDEASGAVCIRQTAQRSGISLWLMFYAVELRESFQSFPLTGATRLVKFSRFAIVFLPRLFGKMLFLQSVYLNDIRCDCLFTAYCGLLVS